jgi:hypothetical protein
MPIKLWKYKITAFQNPTLKKLILYSMAEVLLVVLGILLALEVDNWKEPKKIIIAENNTLIGLHEDLSQNLSNIQSIVRRDSLRIIGNRKIIDLLKDPYSNYQAQYDSLFGQILEYDVFFSQRLSYETIDNNGIVVIRNEQLRTKIAYLYDYALTELERQGNSCKQQLAMKKNRFPSRTMFLFNIIQKGIRKKQFS